MRDIIKILTDKALSIVQQPYSSIYRTNLPESGGQNILKLAFHSAESCLVWYTLTSRMQEFHLSGPGLPAYLLCEFQDLPSKCPCRSAFTVMHAMNCHRGGLINCRHGKLRNFEANLVKQVCRDVQIEPMLQPTDGQTGFIGQHQQRRSFGCTCQRFLER